MSSLIPHLDRSATRGRAALLRPLLAALVLCALLLALAPPGADASPRARISGYLPNCHVATAVASFAPRTAPTIRLARAAVCLINARRSARGLPRLRINHRLSRAARWHTHDMVRRSYFGHVSQRGRDVVDRLYGARYLGGRFSWAVGENLAWGSGSLGTPRAIVRAWMDSPGHRRNMLDRRYREIGIGVIAAGPVQTEIPAATYTTTFGVRR
ncbi:MAG TPA: CAP domain-containing protein [Thermoleophilaceae bacterium]|nr:CAP domain-containing protein [Thermoleophilaceae bacterium]